MWKRAAFTVVAALMLVGTGEARQIARLPEPVAGALMLLGWSGDDVPQIEIVSTRPPDVGATADGWVRFDVIGRALPIIYVCTDADVYRDAAKNDYQALVRLAGILVHERWHLRHGRDEVGAYSVQLSTMEYLHANTMNLAEIRRALRLVSRDRQKPLPRE